MDMKSWLLLGLSLAANVASADELDELLAKVDAKRVAEMETAVRADLDAGLARNAETDLVNALQGEVAQTDARTAALRPVTQMARQGRGWMRPQHPRIGHQHLSHGRWRIGRYLLIPTSRRTVYKQRRRSWPDGPFGPRWRWPTAVLWMGAGTEPMEVEESPCRQQQCHARGSSASCADCRSGPCRSTSGARNRNRPRRCWLRPASRAA
jgi:hypothetical protein